MIRKASRVAEDTMRNQGNNRTYMNGNEWENLCVQCYRIRYQKDNYTAMPATQGGDAGIEGFTYKGVVHQCYCPERDYSDNELYDHQRDKLTVDIEKLKKNANRLKALGVPPVVEWHFNIPEYKDTRILTHAESKRQKVIKAKKISLLTMYISQMIFKLSLKQQKISHRK